MEKTNRSKDMVRGSLVCLAVNFFLFAVKCAVGLASGSVTVIADAFNNLSDTGSGFVTLLGFRLSEKPSDDEHPFGHGRIEYISGLIVSFIILLLGIELAGSAVQKILHPAALRFSGWMLAVLALSVPVKLFLGLYCRRLGKRSSAPAMLAAGQDSLSDALVTGVTLVSAFVSLYFERPVDGILGLGVSLWVLWSGLSILRDTLGPLLGQAPPAGLVSEIEKRIRACPGVCGVHDLIVHNYGPEQFIASVHAEVRADCDILKIHDAIDLAERCVLEELGVLITVHLDPIDTDDALTNSLREKVRSLIEEIDPALSMHDFRIVSGDTHTNLIFDLVIPRKFAMSDRAISDRLNEKLKAQNPSYFLVITFERTFV